MSIDFRRTSKGGPKGQIHPDDRERVHNYIWSQWLHSHRPAARIAREVDLSPSEVSRIITARLDALPWKKP